MFLPGCEEKGGESKAPCASPSAAPVCGVGTMPGTGGKAGVGVP